MARQKFLNKNFPSMNEDDKEKWNKAQNEYFNEYRKKITGIAAGEKEMKFLQKMLEEELK